MICVASKLAQTFKLIPFFMNWNEISVMIVISSKADVTADISMQHQYTMFMVNETYNDQAYSYTEALRRLPQQNFRKVTKQQIFSIILHVIWTF